MKTDQELQQGGFTNAGIARFKVTVTDYSDELFAKSVSYGDVDRTKDQPREVTHDHVRRAAFNIATSFSGKGASKQKIVCQAGEYVCVAAAGFGGGHINTLWGLIVFFLSVAVGVMLFVLLQSRKDLQ